MPCVYLDVHAKYSFFDLAKDSYSIISYIEHIHQAAEWFCRLIPFSTLVGTTLCMLPFSENVLGIEIKILLKEQFLLSIL